MLAGLQVGLQEKNDIVALDVTSKNDRRWKEANDLCFESNRLIENTKKFNAECNRILAGKEVDFSALKEVGMQSITLLVSAIKRVGIIAVIDKVG